MVKKKTGPKSILTEVGKMVASSAPTTKATKAPEPEVKKKKKRRTPEEIEQFESLVASYAVEFEAMAREAQMVALQAYTEWTYSQVSTFHEIDSLKKRELAKDKKNVERMQGVLILLYGHLQSLPHSDRVEAQCKRICVLLDDLRKICG